MMANWDGSLLGMVDVYASNDTKERVTFWTWMVDEFPKAHLLVYGISTWSRLKMKKKRYSLFEYLSRVSCLNDLKAKTCNIPINSKEMIFLNFGELTWSDFLKGINQVLEMFNRAMFS
jgi:hypothetical protein